MERNKKEQDVLDQLEGRTDGYKSARKEVLSTVQEEEQTAVKNNKTRTQGTVPFEFGSIMSLFFGLTIGMLICAMVNILSFLYFYYYIYFLKFVPYAICLFIYNYSLKSTNKQARFQVYSKVIFIYTNLCIVLSCIFDFAYTVHGLYAFLGHGASFVQSLVYYMVLYTMIWGIGHVALLVVFLVLEFIRCKKNAFKRI